MNKIKIVKPRGLPRGDRCIEYRWKSERTYLVQLLQEAGCEPVFDVYFSMFYAKGYSQVARAEAMIEALQMAVAQAKEWTNG